MEKYGSPEILNTDQGSQFTADLFTEFVLKKKIRISMDGRGRALDNIFIERLWRSVKYEEVYLNSWLNYYNNERTHTGKHCYGKTPMQSFLDSRSMAREKLLETLVENQKIITFGRG